LAIADNGNQVEVTVLLKNSNGSSIVGSHLNLEIESGDGVTVVVPCEDSDINGRSCALSLLHYRVQRRYEFLAFLPQWCFETRLSLYPS
jgi:hypothetical protein